MSKAVINHVYDYKPIRLNFVSNQKQQLIRIDAQCSSVSVHIFISEQKNNDQRVYIILYIHRNERDYASQRSPFKIYLSEQTKGVICQRQSMWDYWISNSFLVEKRDTQLLSGRMCPSCKHRFFCTITAWIVAGHRRTASYRSVMWYDNKVQPFWPCGKCTYIR
jgi:hypothetical protein